MSHNNHTSEESNTSNNNKTQQSFKDIFSSLKEGYVRYKLLFDKHKNVQDCRYLEINSSWAQMMQVSEESYLGNLFSEVAVCEPISIIKKAYKRKNNSEDSFFAERVKIKFKVKFFPFENGEIVALFSKMDELTNEEDRLTLQREQFESSINNIKERENLAKQDLAVKTEQFHLATTSGSVGIVDNNISHNTIYFSDEARSLMGCEKEGEITWNEAFKNIHPEDIEKAINHAEWLRSGKIPSYVVAYRFLVDGVWKWRQMKEVIIQQSANDEVERIMGVILDINQSKKAEEDARGNLLKMKAALNASMSIYWEYDCVNERYELPDNFADALGIESTNISNYLIDFATFNKIIEPEELEEKEILMKKLYGGEINNFSFTHLIITPKQEKVFLHSTYVAHSFDNNGRLLRIVGYSTNISAEKNAQFEVDKANEHKRDAEKLAKITHWEFDISEKIITYNDISEFKEVSQKKHYSSDDYIKHIHPDYRELFLKRANAVIITKKPDTFEYQIDINNKRKYFIVNMLPQINKDGNVVKLSGNNQDITEIKEVQERLNKQLKALNNAEDLSKMGSFTQISGSLKAVWWSRGMYNIFEIPYKESRKERQCVKYFSEKSLALFEKNCKLVIEKGVQSEADYTITTAKNNIKILRIRCFPLIGSGKNVVGLDGVIYDVTDVVETERELAKTQNERKLILDNISTGVVFLNPDMTVKWHNNSKSIHDSIGINILSGQHCYQEIAKRSKPCENCPAIMAFKTKKLSHNQIQFPNGKQFHIVASPVLDNQNECIGVVETIEDITQIKKIEFELKDAKKRTELMLQDQQFVNDCSILLLQYHGLRKLLDISLPYILDRLGLSMVSIHFYDQLEKQFIQIHKKEVDVSTGMQSKKEPLPETIWSTFSQNNGIALTLGDKEISEAERQLLENNNTSAMLCMPIYVNQELGGYIRADRYSNNNQWLEIEQELLRGVVNLIGFGIERQQNEDELISARDKAQESDRLKTAFLANMSHEIRTPLNGIVGFSSLAMEDSYSEDQKKHFSKMISYNSQLLINLINDILDLSKIESGLIEIKNEAKNIDLLCNNIIDIKMLSVSKGVELLYQKKVENLHCMVDENKLMQVLLNLLSNAMKFTETGSIEVGYELVEQNKFILFFVKDTGIGISEESLSNVFDRFTKLNRHIQGSGLGLAICQAIVESQGGKIWVESTKGEGSTFFFTIPYLQAKSIQNDSITIEKRVDPPTKREPISKKTILIAEDNESNYYLLEMILLGSHNILWAKNGKEAIEIAENKSVDLVLMDLKMPVMDGLEATRRIREFSKIPIIAVSADAYEADKIVAFEAGCNGFLQKPIGGIEVLEKIESWFE